MMPIPPHLDKCVVPKDTKIDESPLDAAVRCPCGSQKFEFLFPGTTHKYQGETTPCTAEVGGAFFFLLEARCLSCGTRHLLFDKDFHGWNGFVCHDPEQASLPRPPLTAWKCRECDGVAHQGSIRINSQGKEDFVSEAGDEFDANRWPEAFDWFSMSIQCCSCGLETAEWVSYETM